MSEQTVKRAGRPRGFDEEQVLDAALDVFWTKGFEATSLVDLMKATGLHKASLYGAFGTKRGLYVRVLDRYLTNAAEMFADRVAAAPDAVSAVGAYFDHALGLCAEPEFRGCFKVNAQVEFACNDDELAARFAEHDVTMRATLAGAIERGRQSGVFRSDRTTQELAQYLLTFATGVFARARGGLPARDARALADTAIDALRA
ncbi:MAG: TetR/AcrR family transcriptional regulator [Planctomycetota bacterium]